MGRHRCETQKHVIKHRSSDAQKVAYKHAVDAACFCKWQVNLRSQIKVRFRWAINGWSWRFRCERGSLWVTVFEIRAPLNILMRLDLIKALMTHALWHLSSSVRILGDINALPESCDSPALPLRYLHSTENPWPMHRIRKVLFRISPFM